jgi:hypothetical protein
MAPPSGNVGEPKYVNGSTNIDCNDIGVPYHEVTRHVGASKRAPVHQVDTGRSLPRARGHDLLASAAQLLASAVRAGLEIPTFTRLRNNSMSSGRHRGHIISVPVVFGLPVAS